MSVLDNDRGRDLLYALLRGDELGADDLHAFLRWAEMRDIVADDLADRLRTAQRGWAR